MLNRRSRADDHLHPRDTKVRTRLSCFDGIWEGDEIELDGVVAAPVDRWLDGVRAVRGRAHPADGRRGTVSILGADGTESADFDIGGCVNDLACTSDDLVWVSSGDQGAMSDVTPECHGLVAFDRSGKCIRTFDNTNKTMFDRDALTTQGKTVWICPHARLPIIRGAENTLSLWQNEVRGAHAMAAHGSLVILAGGYASHAESPDERRRLVLLEPTSGEGHADGTAVEVSRLELPAGFGAEAWVQGLGESLHIVEGDRWFSLSIHDWVRQVGTPKRRRKGRKSHG